MAVGHQMPGNVRQRHGAGPDLLFDGLLARRQLTHEDVDELHVGGRGVDLDVRRQLLEAAGRREVDQQRAADRAVEQLERRQPALAVQQQRRDLACSRQAVIADLIATLAGWDVYGRGPTWTGTTPAPTGTTQQRTTHPLSSTKTWASTVEPNTVTYRS